MRIVCSICAKVFWDRIPGVKRDLTVYHRTIKFITLITNSRLWSVRPQKQMQTVPSHTVYHTSLFILSHNLRTKLPECPSPCRFPHQSPIYISVLPTHSTCPVALHQPDKIRWTAGIMTLRVTRFSRTTCQSSILGSTSSQYTVMSQYSTQHPVMSLYSPQYPVMSQYSPQYPVMSQYSPQYPVMSQ